MAFVSFLPSSPKKKNPHKQKKHGEGAEASSSFLQRSAALISLQACQSPDTVERARRLPPLQDRRSDKGR